MIASPSTSGKPSVIWEQPASTSRIRLTRLSRKTVETEVDQRIEQHRVMLRDRPERAQLVALAGSMVYGSASDPREAQIERAMRHYGNERRHQQGIRAAMAALRQDQMT